MWKFSDASIHRKLLLVIFSTSILGLAIACLAFEIYERASYRASMVSGLGSDADTLGLGTTASLAFNDRKSAVEMLATIRAETNIVIVTLYDKQGEVFAEYRRAGLNLGFKSPAWKEEGATFGSEELTLSRSISQGGEKIGAIIIVSDLAELHAKMARYREISLLVLLVCAFATFLVSSRLVRLITEPVLQLAALAERVSANEDYALRAAAGGKDELGKLVGSFNQMLMRIQERDVALHTAKEELEIRVEARTRELQLEVAERTQAERNLQASLKEMKDLEEALDQHCIVARTDQRGIISFVNEKFCLISKYTREELIGQDHRIVNSKYHPQEFIGELWTTIKGGRVWKGEIKNQAKDGSTYWVDTTIVPFSDAEGKVRQFIAIRTDITTIKRVEEDLRRAKQVAEAASRAKSEFLANMSHEIRTPLNGVMGMTDLALETQLTPEQRECPETVKMSGDSLLTVINDILDFSKIEAGKIDLEAADFSLRDCLETTLKTLALRADEKGLELLCEVAPEVPEVVRGDSSRLRQVVINLIGNAIKFTNKGEVALRVKSEARDGEGLRLHFTVADTGIGIAEEKRDSIFEPFTQADTSTTRKYGGTGLGLTISTRLVKMMGGEIWVTSEVGRGSEFHFTMRLQVAETKTIEIGTIAPPEILRGVKVVVVDDNRTNRRILEGMLKRWEMKVTCVEGGEEALAELGAAREAGSPHGLVLTDMHMPGMDGFTLVEHIRQKPELSTATIMMLTSAGHRGDAARCQALGVSAYLLKPIRQSELREAIARVLGAREQQGVIPLITRYSLHDAREPSSSLRILLAEDNLVNQRLATRLLEKRGHFVVLAANGREAVTALERESFDLVLMDLQMPEMDGFEATAAIREQEKVTGNHLPIVALTAHAMKGDREKCIEGGMDGYLTKPIRPQELDELLESYVDRRRKAAEEPEGILSKKD
jgi:PAS domain S-box-containing protein